MKREQKPQRCKKTVFRVLTRKPKKAVAVAEAQKAKCAAMMQQLLRSVSVAHRNVSIVIQAGIRAYNLS